MRSSPTPADAVLTQLGITEPHEIDLEAIAWHVGARIKYRPLDSCEACIVGSESHAIITINSNSQHRRQRFSIGHELGHWHHHRKRFLRCQSDDIGKANSDALDPERVADRYAGDLLMPRYIFDPIARSYPKTNFDTVRKIADLFDTSITATAIRLVEKRHFPAILVCHGLDGRKWFTRSPEVPSRWFPKDSLAAESFAFNVLFSAAGEDRFPRKIGADAWFERWDAEQFEVLEQSIRTGEGEILTLVLINDEDMLDEG